MLLPFEITNNPFCDLSNNTLNHSDIESLTQKFKNRQKIFGGYEVVHPEPSDEVSWLDKFVTGMN